MIKRGLVLISVLFAASAANATLPPAVPLYLLDLPESEWLVGDRLHREAVECTEQLCEVGFHDGEFVIAAVRTDDFVQIVAGFEGCESASWNKLFIENTPPEDRPAIVRYLVQNLVSFAAEQCEREVPMIHVIEMSPLFSVAES